MNEHGFTKAVIRILPPEVHVQSMTGTSMTNTGTPDRYFDLNHDLWVEFKYAQSAGTTRGIAVQDMLTARQHRWLERRFKAGGNACVILGLPSDRTRGVVLPAPSYWQSHVTPEYIIHNIKPAAELAAYILERIT